MDLALNLFRYFLSILAHGDHKRKTYCMNWEERQCSLKEDE